jgi:phosphoribosylglycinamide formyltransferase-1
MLNIGFMASYNGSGMVSVLQAVKNGLPANPTVLICNNKNANAFRSAEEYGLPACHLSSKTHDNSEDLDKAICSTLKKYNVDLLLLSGYMKKLGPETLTEFRYRILNIHPSLLPSYGGKGMYGDHVHAAVLENKEKETGATVHIVTEEYDQGPIINQQKVALTNHETLGSIREKVRRIESHLYVDTLQGIISGEISIPPVPDLS